MYELSSRVENENLIFVENVKNLSGVDLSKKALCIIKTDFSDTNLIRKICRDNPDLEVWLASEDISRKNILTANIMVMQNPIERSTINFLAPLVFNFDNLTMAQIVLDSIKYPHYSLAEPIANYYPQDS